MERSMRSTDVARFAWRSMEGYRTRTLLMILATPIDVARIMSSVRVRYPSIERQAKRATSVDRIERSIESADLFSRARSEGDVVRDEDERHPLLIQGLEKMDDFLPGV